MLSMRLWFAFRLYLWLIDSQQNRAWWCYKYRCDLLSDCIFDLLIHSRLMVMPHLHQLWFAFRLYLWLIDSQQRNWYKTCRTSCDLLSDCIFDLLIHSICRSTLPRLAVVICFQIVSLTYWFTAISHYCLSGSALWFAFRLYLWLIDSQRYQMLQTETDSCDLLSDCIFDLLIHSQQSILTHAHLVVICFQIVSLTYWFTAYCHFVVN